MARYEEDVDTYNKVIIDLDLPANKHFVFRINEVEISYERLKLLNDFRLKKMDEMMVLIANMIAQILSF